MSNKSKTTDPSRFSEPATNSERDVLYRQGIEEIFAKSSGTSYEKLWSFSRFVPRQRLTMFLSKYDLMRKLLGVQGSIVEMGVHFGGGLFEWLQLCEILEPRNYQRKIYGFDNFKGFEDITASDSHKNQSIHLQKGGLKADVYDDLMENIKVYDYTRALGHIPKVSIVKGNVKDTLPKFLLENPQIVVSCLYLDIDLYEPTKQALEAFLPRMPKGGIIVFDEFNCEKFPGETVAVHELIGINNLRIQRSTYDTWFSYAVLE